MKKYIFCMVLILSINGFSQGVTKVKDKYKNYQLERTHMIRWNKFKPWWFFNLIPKMKRYKNGEDRRNIFQYLLINEAVKVTQDKSQKQKDSINEMWKDAELINLNRTLNVKWNLIWKSRFSKKDIEFYSLLNELQELEVKENILSDIIDNVLYIKYDIKTLNDSYIDDAKKASQYQILYKKYSEILERMQKIKMKYNSIKRIKEINKIKEEL